MDETKEYWKGIPARVKVALEIINATTNYHDTFQQAPEEEEKTRSIAFQVIKKYLQCEASEQSVKIQKRPKDDNGNAGKGALIIK